jgi:glycosyltransferase involved in cell wall biosynthesis
MKVAYFTNQYPKVSHTFIRREIVALESLGLEIERYSIRETEDKLVDPADIAEKARTKVLLRTGAIGLLSALVGTFLLNSFRFFQALRLAFVCGMRSDRGLLRHCIYLAEACLLAKLLQRSGAEHLHVHFGTNPATVAMLCHVLGGPGYSFTVHGPEEFDKPEGISLGDKIRRARFVVAISEFGRSQLYRWCKHDCWSKIQVVHCGVDAMFLAEPATPVPDVSRLVCVGRLCEQKGQLLLVAAAGKLARDNVDFHLVLVGDGPFRPQIESLAQELGIAERITVTGWKSGSEVRDEILKGRTFVLPSFAEGLPVVIMEALALRRPVISTYIAGIPELVQPGVNGWLVPAGAIEPLAGAMCEALRQSVAELSQMGSAGAARVAEQHDISKEAAKLASHFRSACSH